MSSESVWFEQVDTALVSYVKSIVTLPNSSQELVAVPTKVRKAEEDFEVEEYPCVTLYSLYSRLDKVRADPYYVGIKSKSAVTASMVVEKGATPYNLYYQVDFWALKQSEMNEMTRKWLAQNERDFNLTVKDVSGNTRSCYALMTTDLQKADLLSGTKRVLHSFITYRIYVELDECVQETIPMVVTPVVETKQM